MEQISAGERVDQRFDLFILGLVVFLSFKPSDFILYATRVSASSPALGSCLSHLIDLLGSILELIVDMFGHIQASNLGMELAFFFSLSRVNRLSVIVNGD